MYILAIDTSCDETSVAISHNDVILANIISSQVELHKQWGGVVPSIAQRAHNERIDLAIKSAVKQAGIALDEIDLFAVTQGPGLAIALEIGINKIKELAQQYDKPVVAVNHMAGHLYANLARNKNGKATIEKIDFPALALLVSGNHTEMVLLKGPFNFRIVGQTLDDAMGEAYDKVARMLNLGYPGGPIVAKLAKEGNPSAYDFPIPMKQSGDLHFSFSGLKTAVLYTIRKLTNDGQRQLTRQEVIDIAATFQRVAFASILLKLTQAVKKHRVNQVLLGGGVIANTDFRHEIRHALKPYRIPVYYPNLKKLCTDNAAMIAVAAFYQYQAGGIVKELERLDRDPSLTL